MCDDVSRRAGNTCVEMRWRRHGGFPATVAGLAPAQLKTALPGALAADDRAQLAVGWSLFPDAEFNVQTLGLFERWMHYFGHEVSGKIMSSQNMSRVMAVAKKLADGRGVACGGVETTFCKGTKIRVGDDFLDLRKKAAKWAPPGGKQADRVDKSGGWLVCHPLGYLHRFQVHAHRWRCALGTDQERLFKIPSA